MSENIKVQLLNSKENTKLEHLLKSYNSLKSILSPNLNENYNNFMDSLINLIISQLKIFLEILNLDEYEKLYEILNINNQDLSKQIAYLYDISKKNLKYSNNLLSEKNLDGNQNKIDSYSLEEPKQSFNLKESCNSELIENKNEKESKRIENNNDTENGSIKGVKLNNRIEKTKDKKITDKEREKEKEKLIKKDREEREKLREKEKLIQNLRRQEKEREREYREKARNLMKKAKNKEKEKDFFKIQLKKNSNLTKKNFKNINSDKSKSIKLDDTSSRAEKERKIKTPQKEKDDKKEKFSEIKNKDKNIKRNKTPKRTKDKLKYYLFNELDENNSNEEEKEKTFQRKNKKAKSVLIKECKVPYLISIENSPLSEYISVSFTNRFLNESKSLKKPEKNNLIPIIIEEELFKKKVDKKPDNNCRIKTESNRKIVNKTCKKNSREDYFSLDEFLVPLSSKKGEESFLTKTGNILLNKMQKDILEDYINNYLVQDEEDNKSKTDRHNKVVPMNKSIKEKMKYIKGGKNKKFNLKGTNTIYDLDDINELLQKLPSSFQIPINEFYLKRKKASQFNRSIFKICHKVIDNYKELENKEDIFSFKSKSRNKTKSKGRSAKYLEKSNSINKYNMSYRKIYSS